jgi:hypothetical protein
VLYVGDGDAEGVGNDEIGCPFWWLTGKLVEPVAGVDEVLPETFPSSLAGFAAVRIPSIRFASAFPGRSSSSSLEIGSGCPASSVTSQPMKMLRIRSLTVASSPFFAASAIARSHRPVIFAASNVTVTDSAPSWAVYVTGSGRRRLLRAGTDVLPRQNYMPVWCDDRVRRHLTGHDLVATDERLKVVDAVVVLPSVSRHHTGSLGLLEKVALALSHVILLRER